MNSTEAVELLSKMLENQQATDKKFTLVLEGFQASKKETAFVDVAMKVGIAMTVAGIMFVGSALPNMQVKMTEISVTQMAMKETLVDLQGKYDTEAFRTSQGFATRIQPYELRLVRTEERLKEAAERLEKLKVLQAENAFKLELIKQGRSE